MENGPRQGFALAVGLRSCGVGPPLRLSLYLCSSLAGSHARVNVPLSCLRLTVQLRQKYGEDEVTAKAMGEVRRKPKAAATPSSVGSTLDFSKDEAPAVADASSAPAKDPSASAAATASAADLAKKEPTDATQELPPPLLAPPSQPRVAPQPPIAAVAPAPVLATGSDGTA